MTDLRAIGYWQPTEGGALPWPGDLVDASWDPSERDFVVEYLAHGFAVTASMGVSRCRLCGVPNGSRDVTDGVFIWPEGLSHYLVEHGVRLPGAFVDEIRHRLADLEVAHVDESWWEANADA